MGNLVSPERIVSIGGKNFTLIGNLKALKSIQQEFDCEIIRFLVERTGTLSFENSARIIRLGIEAGDAEAPQTEVIEQEIVDVIGIVQARRVVAEWLLLSTTPKEDRTKKAQELAKALEPGRPASRGKNTSGSV